MGVSDFRRSRGEGLLAGWACWDCGPSGWILGPELTLTRHPSDQQGVPTYEQQAPQCVGVAEFICSE
eukprot:9055393-Alexandrium_andersonii.AAC.1